MPDGRNEGAPSALPFAASRPLRASTNRRMSVLMDAGARNGSFDVSIDSRPSTTAAGSVAVTQPALTTRTAVDGLGPGETCSAGWVAPPSIPRTFGGISTQVTGPLAIVAVSPVQS